MPRTKEFSESVALEQALQIFWEKGYECTSLQDLIAAMGISKSSFYETFGSKYDLFLSAIENYVETRVGGAVSVLDGEPSGKKAVAKIFAHFIENGERGCLLCNSAVEFALRDPAVENHITRGMKRLEDAYHRAVVRGQEAGEIPAGKDARPLARFLLNCEHGLFVSSRSGLDKEALGEVVQVALSALE